MGAKLHTRGNARYIQFAGRTGRRKTISLGAVAEKTANAILYHVDHLVESSAFGNPPPRPTAEWLATVPDKLHAKLVDRGLTSPRVERASAELAAFCDRYITGRSDLRPMTVNVLKQTRRVMVAFFTAKRDLTTINRGEARDWFIGLGRTFATATVAAYLKKARQIFGDAVDRKLITENPFDGIKAGSQVNESRQRFVPAVDVLAVMDQCPDAEWRVVFALARFGGLRCPSEVQAMRWMDVDFAAKRMTIRSSKLARHEGKAVRVLPIFPDLMPWLREAYDAAPDGAEFVVGRRRGENLRTMTRRFVDRAGLTPWPKLFQNMRSSRQTELEDEFPTHVVCRWLGNSPRIARRHYLQTTDRHFDKALRFGAAQGAALQRVTEAPVAHQNVEKPAGNAKNGDDQCSWWESNKHPFSKGIEGVRGKALRNSLRRLRQTSCAIYQASTAKYRTRPSARTGVAR